MATPTKPLWVARFAIVDDRLYTPAMVFADFSNELKDAGYTLYQTPAVRGYTPKFEIIPASMRSRTTDKRLLSADEIAQYTDAEREAFADTNTDIIFDMLKFYLPDGGLFIQPNQVKDFKGSESNNPLKREPPGNYPMVEKRSPRITTIAWNLGPPKGATFQSLRKLLTDTAKNNTYWLAPNPSPGLKGAHYTKGFLANYFPRSLTDVVNTWQSTPFTLPNYPDRPPIPKSLLPVKPPPPPPPAPIVKPKKPKKPKVIVAPSFFSKYWKWLLGGGLAAWYLMNKKGDK